MRRILFYIFVITIVIFGVAGSCNKSNNGGGGTPGGGEANLQVVINPAAGSTQPASPDLEYPLSVTIMSTMPSQGVTIDVVAKPDDGSGASPFFTATSTTSAPISNFVITNTPLNVQSMVSVTVTSKTNANNKWIGSYRYSRK